MPPSTLDKQTAGSNSLNDWLMSLAMYVAALCDMCHYVEVTMAPMDAICLFSVLM